MLAITLDFTAWDVALFENLWMYFPGRAQKRRELKRQGKETDDDKPDWCNYQGWYQEYSWLYVDFALNTYECSGELWNVVDKNADLLACGWK